ncbi:hypothetical protein D3C80_2146390 [compost metagenome]
MLYEEGLTADTLIQAVESLYGNRDAYIERMSSAEDANALASVYEWMNEIARK